MKSNRQARVLANKILHVSNPAVFAFSKEDFEVILKDLASQTKFSTILESLADVALQRINEVKKDWKKYELVDKLKMVADIIDLCSARVKGIGF